jgi:hypothetical protein
MRQEAQSDTIRQKFGTDTDVERLTGRKRATLQKDRHLGRGFPFYRVGRKILYDLDEIHELIRTSRVDFANRSRSPGERANRAGMGCIR